MLRRFLVLTASAALFVPMLAADDPNAAQKVKALVTKLGAEKEADRKAAEEELIKFGVAALPHLPASEDKNLTAEQKERLSRVLPKIWQARVEQDVAGSFVEIPKGAMPLADALREIERQTGNVVRDQREEFNEEATNPTIQFDGKKRKFWEAMDLLCKDAGITLEHFAGESAISIRAQGMGANPSTVTIGALRFTPQTITLTRNLGMGPAKCTVNILSVFEPRLKPMLVEVDVDSFKILDDQNRALKFAAERQQSMYTFQVQEGAHSFEIALDLEAPDRSAKTIKSITGEAALRLPAVTEQFTFDKWTGSEMQERATPSMKVKVGKSKDEGDGLWSFQLNVAMLGEKPEGESFLTASLDPEIYLVNADGSRLAPNAGKEVGESDGETAITYLISGAPGKLQDYKVVCRIPSGVTRVPVKFELKDLPLP
jgi:hypothetical protein